MIMAFMRMSAAAWFICLFCLVDFAAAQGDGNVVIYSDPQGSLVVLTGDVSLSGVTPVKFDRPLSGRYEIEINRDGYEIYRSTAYFSEQQMSQLEIRLVRKTRIKALMRSLVFPGWGQRYYGDNTKSTLFLLGAALSSAGYFIIKDDYDSKMDDYHARLSEYDNATKWSDLPSLAENLRDAQQKASDAEDDVNLMKAVVAGVYVLNVLDAFVFFPNHAAYTEYKAITARPQLDSGRVGLALSMRF